MTHDPTQPALSPAGQGAPPPLDPDDARRPDFPNLEVAAVAHDLRNSVAALRLVVEGVNDGVLPVAPGSVYSRQMLTHVRVVSHLVTELGHLSGGQRPATQRRVTTTRPLIRDAAESMLAPARAMGVALEIETEEDLPPLLCEPEQIARVLVNLLDNAIRHTAEGGRILVTAAVCDGLIEVGVHDTGDGQAPWRPEARPPDAPTLDAGTSLPASVVGLGLSIARSIVEAHGGRIWLEPRDRGASLRFTLPPLREDELAAPASVPDADT